MILLTKKPKPQTFFFIANLRTCHIWRNFNEQTPLCFIQKYRSTMQLTMLCQCFIYTEQIFSTEVLKFKKNFYMMSSCWCSWKCCQFCLGKCWVWIKLEIRHTTEKLAYKENALEKHVRPWYNNKICQTYHIGVLYQFHTCHFMIKMVSRNSVHFGLVNYFYSNLFSWNYMMG